MKANNPQIIDGKVYDLININLAVTLTNYSSDYADCSIALRLVPTRIEPASTDADGNVIPEHAVAADAAAIGQVLGRIDDGDDVAKAAIAQVYAVMEAYLKARGI
jgi:hypothetical protein